VEDGAGAKGTGDGVKGGASTMKDTSAVAIGTLIAIMNTDRITARRDKRRRAVAEQDFGAWC
jgi:hypothetical protein